MAEKKGFNNNKFTSSNTFLVSGIVAQWTRSCLHVQMSIPDLGSASDWLKQISQAARIIRNTTQIWVVLNASSEWYFCAPFSDVISRRDRWWRRKMWSVFSG